MTIQPKEVIQGNELETYLPEINTTFIRDNTDVLDTKQQNIVQHLGLPELKNKKKHTKRPSVRIYEEDEPRMSYGFPKPILKRSLSTRF